MLLDQQKTTYSLMRIGVRFLYYFIDVSSKKLDSPELFVAKGSSTPAGTSASRSTRTERSEGGGH